MFALCILASSVRSQVVYRFDAPAERPTLSDLPVMRGETVTLSPRLTLYGAPLDLSGATVALYLQTNGMGSAWWIIPADISLTETGRVSAVFHRTNDVGAAAYSWFIGVTHTNAAVSYRAAGRLAMRPAPGFSPASAPAPSYYPTLAAALAPLIVPELLALSSPPWLTLPSWQAGSNALAAAIQAVPAQISSATSSLASAASVAASLASATSGLASVASVASLTNQARTWIDYPGATNFAFIASNQVAECSLAYRWRLDSSSALYPTNRALPDLPYPLVDGYTAAIDGFNLYIHAATLSEFAGDGLGWVTYGPFSMTAGATLDFVYGAADGQVSLYPETLTNLLSSSAVPIAPIPPYVQTLSGLLLWIDQQQAIENARLQGKVDVSAKELHADSFTNVIWKTTFSNGWQVITAYTNTP